MFCFISVEFASIESYQHDISMQCHMQKWYFLHLCDIVLYINPKGNISKDVLSARGIWREDGCMQRWLTGEPCSVRLSASSSVGCKCKEHHQAILLNSPPSYPSTATASFFFFPLCCLLQCSRVATPDAQQAVPVRSGTDSSRLADVSCSCCQGHAAHQARSKAGFFVI